MVVCVLTDRANTPHSVAHKGQELVIFGIATVQQCWRREIANRLGQNHNRQIIARCFGGVDEVGVHVEFDTFINAPRIRQVVVVATIGVGTKAVGRRQHVTIVGIIAQPDPWAITEGFTITWKRNCCFKLGFVSQINMRTKASARFGFAAAGFGPRTV